MISLTQRPEWIDLKAHKETLPPLKEMNNNFTLEHQGIYLDYSKNTITKETLDKLVTLAKACDLEAWREKLFSGERVNNTENRSVLHMALRAPKDADFSIDGKNIMPSIYKTLQRMKTLSDTIRSEGKIKDIVNIGIGGSDLGPHMVCEALKHLADTPRIHFVSNVDGAHINETLKHLQPETTIFLIASKTFVTQETMTNAHTAREWFLNSSSCTEEDIPKHFFALAANKDSVMEFGIPEENMIPFNDWVGGRYSLHSSIGLSICLSIGFENFRALLDGAYAMDKHFRTASLHQNMPIILGLLGIWYRNFWDTNAHAILPYAQNLHRFPAFLQQMDMESNGKSVTRDGNPIDYPTGPIIFGESGTNGQHAFYQLLHQGTSIIPSDFILIKKSYNGNKDHHKKLLANGLAQTDALMNGKTLAEADNAPHRVFEGNRPSNTIVLDELSPFHLGQLIALYEHKVFVQGILWNINSFDQYGVQLGKELAHNILEKGPQTPLHRYVLEDVLKEL